MPPGRGSWTNEEEGQWLDKGLADFETARTTDNVPEFMLITQQGYFDALYPDVVVPEDATKEQQEQIFFTTLKRGKNGQEVQVSVWQRKVQIYWYYWNRRVGKDKKPRKKKERVLDLSRSAKRPVKRQAYQAYVDLHSARVLPIIRARFNEYRASLPEVMPEGEKPKEWLQFMGEVGRELLAKEPQEIREEVEQNRTKLPEAAALDLFTEPGADVTAQELYKRAHHIQELIDGMAKELQDTADSFERQTSWKCSIIVSGPRPDTGTYATLAFHAGVTANLGHTLPDACAEWKPFMNSFGKFAVSCYPKGTAQKLNEAYRGGASTSRGASETAAPEPEPSASSQPANTSISSQSQPSAVDSPSNSAAALPKRSSSDGGTEAHKSSSEEHQSDVAAKDDALAYERERQANIQKRNELFQSLGLDKDVEQLKRAGPRPKPRSRRPKQPASTPTSVNPRTRAAIQAAATTSTPAATTAIVAPTSSATPDPAADSAPATTANTLAAPDAVQLTTVTVQAGSQPNAGGADAPGNNAATTPPEAQAASAAQDLSSSIMPSATPGIPTAFTEMPLARTSGVNLFAASQPPSTLLVPLSNPASPPKPTDSHDGALRPTESAAPHPSTPSPDSIDSDMGTLSSPGQAGFLNLRVLDIHAPDWVRDALDYFECLEMGGRRWVSLVNAWQEFEMEMGYPDSRKKQNNLPNTLRPEEIAIWMKDGRDYDKLPEINLADYPDRWTAWWVSLQPACRRSSSSDTTWPLVRSAPNSGSDWDALWRGGPCGMFLVVISLAWWLCAAAEENVPLKGVQEAITDVLWVFETASGERPTKRAREDGELAGEPQEKRLRTE